MKTLHLALVFISLLTAAGSAQAQSCSSPSECFEVAFRELQEARDEIVSMRADLARTKTEVDSCLTKDSAAATYLTQGSAHATFVKPGAGVAVSLNNCSEDHNFTSLGTVHNLSAVKCGGGRVAVGIRNFGNESRVDRVYCCNLSGTVR